MNETNLAANAQPGTGVRLDRVGFSYASTLVFRDFTVAIPPGDRVSILGPSGSGKTTLLRLIAGLEKPDEGTVSFDGAGATNAPRIAMVFQEPRLLPWRSVQFNVGLGVADPPLVDLWLDRVGLSGDAHRLPADLSGGMRQRVALARAMAAEPDILLVDEPLTGLDVAHQKEISDLVHATIGEAGTTLILVTHDVDLGLSLSHRVMLLGNELGAPPRQWPLQTDADRKDVRRQVVSRLRAIRDSTNSA